jgi:hypothetical protein
MPGWKVPTSVPVTLNWSLPPPLNQAVICWATLSAVGVAGPRSWAAGSSAYPAAGRHADDYDERGQGSKSAACDQQRLAHPAMLTRPKRRQLRW